MKKNNAKKKCRFKKRKKKKNGNDFRSEKVLKSMSKPGIFERKYQPLQVGKALL